MGCSNTERSQTPFLILLYTLLFTTKWSSASERMTRGDEPQCTSRFDYEYKVIQKLVQLEEQLKDVTETINKQKETINAQETEINTFKEWRKMQEETRTALKAEISTLSDTDKKLQEKSQSYDQFQNITGIHVGFTVTSPKDNTNPRLFETVIYNSSPGFNTATGKFLCVHPGMYLFTATVIREPGASGIDCYISVNGSNKARALANNIGSTSAYPSGSDTLIIHLKAGDEVYLTGCSSSHMYRDSSFSGVLIQPDIQ